MAKALTRQQLMDYARTGAQARIGELRAELQRLEALFGDGAKRSGRGPAARAGQQTKRPRRKMSAEGRKKIADAAKKRWAKWRAENKAEKK